MWQGFVSPEGYYPSSNFLLYRSSLVVKWLHYFSIVCGIGKAPVNRPSGKSVESKKESETAKAEETLNSVAEEKASEEPAKAEEKTSEEPAKSEEKTSEEPAKSEEKTSEGLAKSEEKTSEELAKSEEKTSEELAKTEEKTSEELAESEEKPSQESKAEEKSSEEPKAEDNPIEIPKVEDNASEEKKPENPESGKDGEKESTELWNVQSLTVNRQGFFQTIFLLRSYITRKCRYIYFLKCS